MPSSSDPEACSAPFGGRRVAYTLAGAGSPIGLLHGLGGAASNWVELAPRLAARHRVIAVDLPGHGMSDPPAAVGSLDTYADAVAACLERERAKPAALVGHSFGGAVALRLAARRPELVSALVLAAAAGISSTGLRARVGLRALAVLRPSRLVARHRDQVARSVYLRRLVFAALASDPAALSPTAVQGFLAGSAAVSDSRTAMEALVAYDARTALDGIVCPVLVLWGARDRFLPLEDGLEYARRLRAPLRVLPDTGHLLIAEQPEACALLIEQFLTSHGVGQVDELPVEVELIGQEPG